ncbi:MAG: hypothetical protein L3J97_05485 [Thermoplasmata archaeon]|nr:hypothetical protein [Thermoplasmata archaeon]
MYGAPGAMSYVPPSGSTAKTLILVGLILQLIFALLFLFAFGVSALLLASIGVFPIFAVVWIAFGALGFVWLILIWMLCYKPVTEGHYEAARTPTLVFAILSFVTFSIISAILYLIAYIKLGDAVREQQMPPQGYPGAPMAPMAPAAPYAAQPMAPYAAQPMAPAAAPPAPGTVMCPKCGKPATFVPQYNRYYCYTDQQYV